MTLRSSLRFRAPASLILTAALAFSPAVAEAAAKKAAPAASKKKVAAKKEANGQKPVVLANGLGSKLGQSSKLQLAAMNTAIAAAPAYFTGLSTGCQRVTAMLASQGGNIMAGNFRDSSGGCYVWLNMQQSEMLTGSEICQTTLHEMGHLNGLQHSEDPANLMFSPFQSQTVPAVCAAPAPVAAAKAKAKTTKRTAVCPAGTTNPDYCAAASN